MASWCVITSYSIHYTKLYEAKGYKERAMSAYAELQSTEFESEDRGYTATKHQKEVGTGYFDEVRNVIMGGESSTGAMADSTEAEQF